MTTPTPPHSHTPILPHPHTPILLLNHVSQISGAERSLLGLARNLPAEEFAVEAALPSDGPLWDEFSGLGLPLHEVRLGRLYRRGSPIRRLAAAARLGVNARLLSALVRRRGLRLVHCNSTTAALAGLLAARWARVPGIWHVRDLVPLGGIGAWLGRMATRVMAISKAVAEQAAGWGIDPARIVTVTNGIDPEAFRPDPEAGARLREELGIPPDAYVIADAGQIVPWKSHHVLLDALGRLRRASSGRDIRCLIAGADLFNDHPDYHALLRARALQPDLAGAVVFLGHRPDVAAVYNACDLFVLPSRREPFGRALIEAMACGKPCIANNEGGPAEILADGDTGLLVPPADPEALANAIGRLQDDPDLAGSIAAAGRERVLAEYTEARTASRIAEVYRQVLGEGVP